MLHPFQAKNLFFLRGDHFLHKKEKKRLRKKEALLQHFIKGDKLICDDYFPSRLAIPISALHSYTVQWSGAIQECIVEAIMCLRLSLSVFGAAAGKPVRLKILIFFFDLHTYVGND